MDSCRTKKKNQGWKLFHSSAAANKKVLMTSWWSFRGHELFIHTHFYNFKCGPLSSKSIILKERVDHAAIMNISRVWFCRTIFDSPEHEFLPVNFDIYSWNCVNYCQCPNWTRQLYGRISALFCHYTLPGKCKCHVLFTFLITINWSHHHNVFHTTHTTTRLSDHSPYLYYSCYFWHHLTDQLIILCIFYDQQTMPHKRKSNTYRMREWQSY